MSIRGAQAVGARRRRHGRWAGWCGGLLPTGTIEPAVVSPSHDHRPARKKLEAGSRQRQGKGASSCPPDRYIRGGLPAFPRWRLGQPVNAAAWRRPICKYESRTAMIPQGYGPARRLLRGQALRRVV